MSRAQPHHRPSIVYVLLFFLNTISQYRNISISLLFRHAQYNILFVLTPHQEGGGMQYGVYMRLVGTDLQNGVVLMLIVKKYRAFSFAKPLHMVLWLTYMPFRSYDVCSFLGIFRQDSRFLYFEVIEGKPTTKLLCAFVTLQQINVLMSLCLIIYTFLPMCIVKYN